MDEFIGVSIEYIRKIVEKEDYLNVNNLLKIRFINYLICFHF